MDPVTIGLALFVGGCFGTAGGIVATLGAQVKADEKRLMKKMKKKKKLS